MNIRLVIKPDNTIAAAVLDDVSFEEASAALRKLEAVLQQKIPFQLVGEPEQHRHEKTEIVLDRSQLRR